MPTPDITSAETQARALLETRMTSVRDLVTQRQQLTELHQQVADAEREDRRLYQAALKDGWSTDELRKIGLPETSSPAATRRRSRRVRAVDPSHASPSEPDTDTGA